MASTDVNNNETIDDEVLRILREARGRPLSLNAITDRSDLFDGLAPVALSLNRLVARGSLCRAPNDKGGKQLYTLRDAVALPEEPAPVAPNAAKAPHAHLILAALRDAGQLTRTQAAAAAGCSPKRASDVLGNLKALGLAIPMRPGLWATAARPWPDEAPQKPAAEPGPAVEKSPSKPADQPAGNQDTEAPPPTPIIALRSDGIVEIRRTAAAVIEITPDEMAELQRFVASLRSARG